MPNVWTHFGITDKYIDACIEMSSYAAKESVEKYWKKCADFLKQMKNVPCEVLSVKQRNWVFNIKDDLKGEGLI